MHFKSSDIKSRDLKNLLDKRMYPFLTNGPFILIPMKTYENPSKRMIWYHFTLVILKHLFIFYLTKKDLSFLCLIFKT